MSSRCTSLEFAHLTSNSEDSDTLEDERNNNICLVYLQPRDNTWIFHSILYRVWNPDSIRIFKLFKLSDIRIAI